MDASLRLEQHENGLVRTAQRGDRHAFGLLYEANVERVYRYVLSRTGDHADAEDITAEVFVSAMRALPSYRPSGVPFVAWLFRIAHNESVNYMKKRSRRRETSFEDAEPSGDDPEEAALDEAAYCEVMRAMSSLTDLQRQLINLRFAGELSISETADVLMRSEGAVKSLQHSALGALRRSLEPRQEGIHGR